MAYCVNTDVVAEFKKLDLNSNTSVTSTEVDEFISQADAEIDARLSVRYQVPITGTNALKVVKQISIGIVAGRVKEILKVKTGQDPKMQEGRSGNPAKVARDRLERLAKGEMNLTDATKATAHQGVKGYTDANSITPKFKRDTDAW